MQTFVLDGTRIRSLASFYDEIERVLIPGQFWGRNLSAFNDILRGGFGTPDEGFILMWAASEKSKMRLGYTETVRQLEEYLANCHHTNRENLQCQLKQAREGVGPTVFDWLMEVILDHGPDGQQAEDNVLLELA